MGGGVKARKITNIHTNDGYIFELIHNIKEYLHVARPVGVQKVESSNLSAPTIFNHQKPSFFLGKAVVFCFQRIFHFRGGGFLATTY